MMNVQNMKRKTERGSALLVTLMVLIGLSLLGLGFVSISETESGISANHRNSLQVQAVAEAGLETVVEWFQDPEWASDNSFLPANVAAIKPVRNAGVYTGTYKPDTTAMLLDKPFKPVDGDRFFGTSSNPDVLINATTLAAAGGAMANYLTNLNQALFSDNDEGGSITEIKVYAPPMLGGTIVGGYYQKGTGETRLGVATVEVTARKCRVGTACTSNAAPDDILAQKTVRAVLSEWPFPGPSGPIQSNAELNTNGSLSVHWGKITATDNLDVKAKEIPTHLPYHDAYNRIAYERGYVDAALGAANDPWPTDSTSSDEKVAHDWIHEIVGRQLQDPWWNAWSRADWVNEGDGVATTPGALPGGEFHPHKYNDPTIDYLNIKSGNSAYPSSVFQFQTVNDGGDRKDVLFPNIEYEFWKEIATSADSIDSVFYLRWIAGDTFEDASGTQKTFIQWVDVTGGAEPGFYFFDTKDQTAPTDIDGDGESDNLTPAIKISGVGGMQMQGFIYVNTELWDATGGGGGGPLGWYAMPGEPYKDDGFWQVDPVTKTDWADDGSGNKVIDPDTVDNNDWDYQELNGDGKFTYYIEERTGLPSALSGGTVDAYLPVTWFPGCIVGVDCSEPHEPYLNLIYPSASTDPVTVGWEAGVGSQRATTTTDEKASGTPVNCGTSPELCTSNGHDEDGGLVQLEPFLNGVLYIEGQFSQTGNMHYFGSVLVQGDAGDAGSPDIWFDERLIKGDWPPADFNFPRVYVSSIQIDQ